MDSLDRPIPVPRSYYGRTGVSSAIRNDYLYDQRQQQQQQQLRQTGGSLVGGDCSSSDNEDELVRIVDRSGCTRTASRHEEPSASAASRRSRWPTTGRTDHSYGANNVMVPTSHQQSARRVYNYSGAPGGGFDNDGAVRARPSPQTLPTHHAVPNSIRGGGVPVEQSRSVAVGTSIPSNNTRHSESCSSLSSVGSGSSSGCEVDGDLGRRRDLVDRLQVASGGDADTLNSSGAGTTAGENVYSRIRDLGFLSTISPPPADTPPAVPQRVAMANASGTQTLGRRPVNRHVMSGHVNHQPIGSAFSGPRDHDGSDSDLPPRFLMHTSSGNVFIPSGNDFNPMSNNAMVPTFPRTVPRTVSLQRTSDRAAAGGPLCDSQNRVSQFVELVLPPPPPINGDMVTRTGNSHDTAAGDERQTMAARFNVVTSTPAAVRPAAAAAHSELKDYLRFTSTCGADSSYRDKKRSPCERWLTWKCGALSLLSLIAILIAIVAYLLAVRFYNLPWHLESGGPLLTDAYAANGSSLGVPISGSAVSAIIARYQLGHVVQEIIPANDFLRTQFFLLEPEAIKFDVTVPRGSVVGIFGRKNTPPTYTKYDFFHVVDGDKIVLSRQTRSAAGYTRNVGVVDSTFVRPMDVGIWYLFIYNDNDKPLEFTFTASQQDVKASSDCISNCNGHGDCVGSTCHCFPGYSGPACNDSVCPALCSGNGIYHAGTCKCYRGWIGNECHLPAADCVNVDCSQHGACVDGQCVCAAGYSGVNCAEETCSIDCGPQGRCEGQRCLCEPGWTGTTCNQRLCDVRCVRGHCDNGTCVCPPGWNGRHCTLEGCPSSCGRHGNCQLFNTGWACDCEDGWKGAGCEIARETECSSGSDEDRDGLIDCQDPDCCIDTACRDSFHCRIAPDPMDILLRKQPPSPGASFYDRMRFLVEDDSVQSYATLSSFNQTQVSVIRGRVLTTDGSAVVGVRVTVVTQPLYGFTLTREQGWFDMLANGGGSVTLQFQRQPFQTQNVTVIVPWNRIITIDPVTLSLESDVGQLTSDILCSSLAEHDHVTLKPVVIATWRHSQLGCCDNTPTSIVPEMRVLRERLRISGTNVHLVHDSSDTPGFQSALFIALTLDSVPESLFLIRLRIVVEGVVFEKDFEVDLRLQYRFAWDRRNAYNQKVYGVATATVYIGYVYRECRLPFWEVHTVKMAGNDLMSSDIGGWNLDVHHTYSVQDGVVYKGDGSNFYLKMSPRPRRLVTVLGDVTGRRRRVECQGCDGRADGNPVLSPVALASGRDGALYIGDYNYIRRLSPGRDDVASILQLSMPDVQYKYYMVVSPLNGRLYITDQQNLRIIRVKTMGPVRELANNFEVIAGTGHQCVPGSADQCGDGGLAIEARLFYPKGIAISKDGVVYFADGANIRAIDESGIIRTIIGSQGPPQYWIPFPCQQAVNISMVKLRWPTSLGISPLTDELHILDDNVILKVTRYHKVIMVAGRPSHCSLSNNSSLPSSGDPLTAVDGRLEHAQNFAFSPDGELFLVESNADDVNRVRVVDTSGRIQHYVGSQCECQGRPNCRCNISSLTTPSAVAVTPDGIVHIADTGIACVHSAVTAEPVPDRSGQFEVVSGPLNEVYVFNRYGQHLSTRDLGTGLLMYNFTYNGYSHYGRLLKVTDAGGQTLVIRRDYKLVARDISAANGERSRITTDTMGQLQAFTTADNVTIRFTYSGNTGLIESREDMASSQQYEYNEVGHLSAVVLTDGRRITVKDGDIGFSGKQVIVAAENSSTTFAITDASINVSQDNLKRTARYIKNGFMSIDLSANTNVVHEFNDKLTTNEYQLSQRRLIHLPNNMTHTTEWWYQLRQDGTHTGASGRANSASGEKLVRRLKVNGETLLSIDLDRVENTETVYSRGHDRLLTVRYDRSGRPIQATPSGPLEPLNVTYGTHGHVTSWTRGDLGVVNVYDDKTGNLVERKLANRVAYRYIYKTGSKPTDVLLPSGRQYQLHYSMDDGGLVALTTPSLAHHQFQRVESLGIDRIIYQPPDANPLRPSYIRDYDSLGRTSQVLYPSGHRRITYNYRGSRTFIFYDWTDVTLDHDAPSGQLIEARLTDRLASNFSVSTRHISSGPLVSSQIVSFGVESSPAATVTSSAGASDGGLSGATFQYTHDPVSLNVIGVEATFGDQSLGTSQFNYSSDTGRLTRTQSFIFEYPQAHREVVRDSNIEITRDFDSRGRFTDVWFRFNNYLVCSLEVKHDALGRIHQWRRKVGSSDLRAYERVYNVDGDVTEVHVSGQPTWRYEYDTDGNIIKANHHGNVRTFSIDAPLGGRLDSASEQSYVHDADGRVIQRDRETFEYDAFGGLTRAFEPGRYDVTFHYDAFHRLVVKRDVITGDIVQYFYADVTRKDRITHIVETSGQSVVGGSGGIGGSRGGSGVNVGGGNRRRMTELFYDSRGKLFAMRRDNNIHYVALDPTDSPVVVLNSVGSVVKQVEYDPLGATLTDSAPDHVFPLGFRCGVVDLATRLVLFVDGRAYDPSIGRWMVPDYDRLVNDIDRLAATPELSNLYSATSFLWKNGETDGGFTTDLSDWLNQLGYDYTRIVPSVDFTSETIHQSLKSTDTSTIDTSMMLTTRVSMTSLIECAFRRSSFDVSRLSAVKRSKIVNPDNFAFQTVDSSSTLSDSTRRRSRRVVSSLTGLFGRGVLISELGGGGSDGVAGGPVIVGVLESAAESGLALVATTLLNTSRVVPFVYTVGGRDVHHFVHARNDRSNDDLRELGGLKPDIGATVAGVNITVHRHRKPSSSGSETVEESIEVRLHGERTLISVRYGTTVSAETERVLRKAGQRAADMAWKIERERAQSGKRSVSTWTKRQVDELLSRGLVSGVHPVYIRGIAEFPKLADDPNNVRFVSSTA